MSDFAKATGAPALVQILGQEYKVFELRPRDLGEMEAWFRSVVPNPRIEALTYMKDQSDAVAMHIWDSMIDQPWPPKFQSEEGQELLLSAEGQARALHIVLRRGFANGQFTLDDARDLTERMSLKEVLDVLNVASPGEPGDPLAGSPPAKETTSPATETTATATAIPGPAAAPAA
jgi:hypothetical protein